MINFEYAKESFEDYLKEFDLEYGKIDLKRRHTYGVIKASEYISNKLELSSEDIELAKVIALLHDIGRFEQIKMSDSFIDNNKIDHAILGNSILFETNLIRKFIKDNQYNSIISKAILNHNRFEIEEGLNERELLHAKIIRDADKIDNFRVKAEDDFESIIDNSNKEILENDVISDNIFKDFMASKVILREDRNTYLDFWVSYIAFIFDFNFKFGLKYIVDNNYINKVIDRLDYKKNDTKMKIEMIRNHAHEYIKQFI